MVAPRLSGILVFSALIVALGRGSDAAHRLQPHTWSIVALDKASGDVGVAAASCFPGPIDALAALVPGHGAAATQAAFDLDNRNAVFDLLQAGQPAAAIVEAITRAGEDGDVALRQYGVVTLDGETGSVAAYTGSGNQAWAGDRQAVAALVTVQGNLLEGEAVLADALAAYERSLQQGLPLSDRLMDALVAGSAAGGDRRCNSAEVRQTAAAAFLMVARADEAPFAVSELGRMSLADPEAPWLYLSVAVPIGGENAVTSLRAQYQERMASERGEQPATAAVSEESADDSMAAEDRETPERVDAFAVLAIAGPALLALAAALWLWRTKRSRRSW